jgi:hypothetical protein
MSRRPRHSYQTPNRCGMPMRQTCLLPIDKDAPFADRDIVQFRRTSPMMRISIKSSSFSSGKLWCFARCFLIWAIASSINIPLVSTTIASATTVQHARRSNYPKGEDEQGRKEQPPKPRHVTAINRDACTSANHHDRENRYTHL